MAARLFLILILLVHPARGALLAGIDLLQGTGATCVTGCCPLCEVLDSCPCVAETESPMPVHEPAIPTDRKNSPLPTACSELPIRLAGAVTIGSPRAPPTGSLRSLDGTVARFLSKLCVWTT